MCSKTSVWSLYGCCAVINVVDYLLTRALVLQNGPWAELNPIERHEIVYHGVSSILWTKLFALAFLFYVTYLAIDKSRNFIYTALLGANTIMIFNALWTGVVFWSYTLRV